MTDFIVTLDVYVFDAQDRNQAGEIALVAVTAGGLSADLLDVQEGVPNGDVTSDTAAAPSTRH